MYELYPQCPMKPIYNTTKRGVPRVTIPWTQVHFRMPA